ncbi:MAG: hypothetical protein OXC30_01025 [Alphaproteobacteria bacterium]|nr:hypothetical protein [Alphaproteobacteria bacterium]
MTCLVLGLLLVLSGCAFHDGADHGSSNEFTSQDVGSAFASEKGVIVQKQTIRIGGSERSGGKKMTGLGTGLGAMGGAAVGLAASNKNPGVGLLTGGILGGIAGTMVEGLSRNSSANANNGSKAFEYTIRLDKDGQTLTVIQPRDVDIAVGEQVAVYRNLRTNAIRVRSLVL